MVAGSRASEAPHLGTVGLGFWSAPLPRAPRPPLPQKGGVVTDKLSVLWCVTGFVSCGASRSPLIILAIWPKMLQLKHLGPSGTLCRLHADAIRSRSIGSATELGGAEVVAYGRVVEACENGEGDGRGRFWPILLRDRIQAIDTGE